MSLKKNAEPFSLLWDIDTELSQAEKIPVPVAKKVVRLLEDGSSVPFIARYRKEVTGNLAPQKLHDIREKYEELKKVQEYAIKVATKIEKAGPVTPQIRQSLAQCKTIHEVEMIEEPFKESAKGTLASRARALNLETLALTILHEPASVLCFLNNISAEAKSALKTEVEVQKSVGHILAEIFAKDMDVNKQLEKELEHISPSIECQQTSTSKTLTDQKQQYERQKYTKYFTFSQRCDRLNDHQILAINRAEKKKFVSVKVVLPDLVKNRFQSIIYQKYPKIQRSSHSAFFESVIRDAWSRLVSPQQIRNCRANLTRRAEESALTVFRNNLRHLLMTSPLRNRTILGIDPGFVHGCKMAIVDPLGNVVHTEVTYLSSVRSKYPPADAKNDIQRLITVFNIEMVAIGNGQGCRAVEEIVSGLIRSNVFKPLHVRYVIVSECGASIYSASSLAESELPTLDVSLRGAVSIARRLQDPLAEMSKVEPKHLGVGMYQHDLSGKLLSRASTDILEECISFVGIDLNYAPLHLLQYISGLSQTRAKAILSFRNSLPEQRFISREQLLEVPGIGQKTFQQCAGFVKILPPQGFEFPCYSSTSSVSSSSHMSIQYVNEDPDETLKPSASNQRKRKLAPSTVEQEDRPTGKKRRKVKNSKLSYNPLDQTVIHPESYQLATQILKDQGFNPSQINTTSLRDHFKGILQSSNRDETLDRYTMNECDLATIVDIATVFSRSGDYDIRENYLEPAFREGIVSIENLSINMDVTGVVSNVTTFGAFCDIGAGQNALIPRSEFALIEWIKAPPRNSKQNVTPSLRLGDRIRATVKELNIPDRRILLRFVKVLTPFEVCSYL